MLVHLLIWLGVFIASLIVLIKASKYLIGSSEIIGKALGLPAFIIGVTLVAIGTSLPELASSIFAVLSGASEIVVSNVIGSNIANIFLILGITAIFAKKIKVLHEIIHVDLPILVGSAFFLAITAWDGIISFFETSLLLAGLVIYLLYTITTQKEEKEEDIGAKRKIKKGLKQKKFEGKVLVVFFVSLFFIFIGAKYVVDSVIELSGILNIGVEIIAVTAIALGTSLPELVVSLSAIKTKKSEIAIGNILGSSIFNIFGVLGISGLFGVLVVPDIMISFGIPMVLIATLMFFFIAQDREVTRWEGWLLLLFYLFFIVKILGFI